GTPSKAARTLGALSEEDVGRFAERFEREIWPLLVRKEADCVGCHSEQNPSQLHFQSSPAESFRRLVDDSYFDPDNGASLLARVSSPRPETRMPPAGMPAWSPKQIGVLRRFVNDLFRSRARSDEHADESFPEALRVPFAGRAVGAGPDNTFLTY